MAKFISVLDADLKLNYWKAVQWADTKSELEANNFYTAGVNLSLPKSTNDQMGSTKTIRETATGKLSQVTVIQLSVASSNIVRLASHKASKQFVKNIEKSFSK